MLDGSTEAENATATTAEKRFFWTKSDNFSSVTFSAKERREPPLVKTMAEDLWPLSLPSASRAGEVVMPAVLAALCSELNNK